MSGLTRHGTASSYNSGCRCQRCSKAHADYHHSYNMRLAERTRAGDPAVPHGTLGGYRNWSCRCVDCCRAASLANGRDAAWRKLSVGKPFSSLTDRERQGWLAYHPIPAGAS